MVMCPSHSHTGILLLWILCAITYNSAICIWGLKVQCNETDRQKLLNFKEQAIDSSGMLSAWSNEQDCCGWAGVECDHLTHRVTSLSLPCQSDGGGDCLAGEFSLSNLLELEFLNYLDLSSNNLLFKPPQCSGNFSSKLLYLDLSFNDPTLKLDDLKWLIHVNSLEYLDLSGIHLHGSLWLQSVSILPSLSELHLSSCQLHVTNPSLEFVNFSSIQVLDISTNNFLSKKLPKWLFNLSHVQDIDLSENFFQGNLPETILNLQKLKSLRLSENELDGLIPKWLGQHTNLQHLDLSFNFFVGHIPETLGNLSFLIELSLSSNLLNGSIPQTVGQLSNLEILGVENTFLNEVICEKNFLHLSNLQHLFLGSPALTFHFDPHWIPSFQLQKLHLLYVHPKLPPWIYTQKSLQKLMIFNSSLSFEDQNKFWNFAAEIEILALSNNSIHGDLSEVVLNSKVTWLEGNNLRGGLPRLSPNVTIFKAINNPFVGALSSLVCHNMEAKSNLSYLQISNAHLSGGLTECWMNWESLVHISLVNNSLTGKIPKSMSLLSNLKSLHLNQNNLSSYIPASFQNFQKLSILNLCGNNFSGDIPYWVSHSLKVLLLRSNQFSGNIPSQLCRLSSLLVLDIADNRLSGTIPNCLHNITAMITGGTFDTYTGLQLNVRGVDMIFTYSFPMLIKGNHIDYSIRHKIIMRVIDFSHNNLRGTIPQELLTLSKLQSLNLANNQLTGRIPRDIGNLKQLESLDLSSNHIGSEIPESMSELSFLGYLNLSFNNFRGQIPSMAQFQRFDAISYIGNPELCGAPLTKNCTEEEKPNLTTPVEIEDEEEFLSCLYMGLGVGFAIGFWAVCASLFFNRRWRHAYFRFLYELKVNFLSVFVKMNILR